MGCGRVGARLALMLTHAGHEVTIMDVQSSAFRRLGSDFKGTTVLGDAIDRIATTWRIPKCVLRTGFLT